MAVMPSRTRRDTQLLGLFVASGRNVMHAAVLLRELLTQWPDANDLLGEIVDAEHEGDRIAHDILHRLAEHGSPLDAADVHALATALDDIVDHAEEAADRLSLYRVEAATDQAVEIADVLVLATREVAAALEALGDGGDLSTRLIEVHRLENEADRLVRSAVATLFVDGIDPMAVIRWKDIFETLEDAVDSCETVANVLEGVCLKRGRSVTGR
jgi:predicted phosphate transport protein (TIGR00153 family)